MVADQSTLADYGLERLCDGPDQGFTHHLGDVVTISTPTLGGLINRVNHTDRLPPWTFGVGELMQNLARRGLLGRAA